MANQKLLTSKDVLADLQVGRVWLWKAEKEGRYPQGIRLTPRCVRFRADLHQAYLNGEWQSGEGA